MEKDNPSQDSIEVEREDDEVGEDLLPADQRERVVSEYDTVPPGEKPVERSDEVDPDFPEFDPEVDNG
jgi:hypothetical protein